MPILGRWDADDSGGEHLGRYSPTSSSSGSPGSSGTGSGDESSSCKKKLSNPSGFDVFSFRPSLPDIS